MRATRGLKAHRARLAHLQSRVAAHMRCEASTCDTEASVALSKVSDLRARVLHHASAVGTKRAKVLLRKFTQRIQDIPEVEADRMHGDADLGGRHLVAIAGRVVAPRLEIEVRE